MTMSRDLSSSDRQHGVEVMLVSVAFAVACEWDAGVVAENAPLGIATKLGICARRFSCRRGDAACSHT